MDITDARKAHAGEPAVTRELVGLMKSIRAGALSDDVKEIARLCVLDWTAVAVAGSPDRLPRLLFSHARDEGGRPLCSVIGYAIRVSPLQAALINGASSHVLDYDDVNLSMNGHPSAATLPALLALGESLDAKGTDLIEAFVVGYETAARVGLLVAPGHYARGYHATCTIGAVAAAAGCAHLLRLDPEQTAMAIGIAATQASGLKSMFGTECKPFHAGLAAQNGLRAAQLAHRGMISRSDALECRQGFAKTLSPDFHPDAALGKKDHCYLRENLFKYHASCYGTHSAIECVRQLRSQHRFTPTEVERVTVRAEKAADSICNISNPKTALEAKFSLRFTTAMALAGRDTSDLTAFSDAATREAELCALRDKVIIELVEGWAPMQAEVIAELSGGRRVRAAYDVGIPDTDWKGQRRRLESKFDRLVPAVLGAARAKELASLLNRVESIGVKELMNACAKPDDA